MRLFIKNKMISLGEGSYVVDENNNNVYNVKGKVFSFTRKKFLYDMEGNLLFEIRNKIFRLFKNSAYILDANGNTVMKIKDKLFSMTFDIEECIENIELKGKFMEGYHVYKDGIEIGFFTLSRDLLSVFVRDAYVLDVFSFEHTNLLTAMVIAYDNIRDNNRN